MRKESTRPTRAVASHYATRSRWIPAALLAVALAACSGGGQPAPKPALQGITIGASQTYAVVGVPKLLAATGHYSDGSTAALESGVTWSSSDTAVASVDATGLVIPWRKGVVQITATHDATGLSATAGVTSRVVISLTAGPALPSDATVDTTFTYFHVSGLSPGTMYTPSIAGMTDDVDLAVYSDVSMTAAVALCSSDNVGTAAESCVAPAPASGELWVAVDGQWTRDGARFSLDVPVTQPVQLAGSLLFPAQLPYSGSVGPTKQFHEVTGLTPGMAYEVRISNLTADLDLEVYADQYEYASLCESYKSGTVDDFCTARLGPVGRFFIEIDGETSRNGGSYTLTVTPK